jgi:hypothetical protein
MTATERKMMAACGVMCSDCPAYLGQARGPEHQESTAAAWRRIYRMRETAANISCGGCSGPEDRLFHTSLRCKARLCCASKGFKTCAECSLESCRDLEKAQAVWDRVPDLAKTLSREDFATYARPYCGHRRRLAAARARRASPRKA